MHKSFKFLLVIVVGLLVIPFSAAFATNADAKPILNIQHWETSNGARVFYVNVKQLPMIDLRVVFAAGSSKDGNTPGLAKLSNSMMGEGTNALNANEIAEKFDAVGAEFSTDSGRDMAMLGLRSLSNKKYLEPALHVFQQVLTQAIFPNRPFLRVKNNTLQAIKQQQQLPGYVANKAFYKAIYQQQPYAHPVIGNSKSISALTEKQVEAFYHQYYVAKNAIIVIVGDINKNQAMTMANYVVSGLPRGKTPGKQDILNSKIQAKLQQINFPSAQTTVIFGQQGVTRKDPDYFPLYVGNYILGGGMISRLFENVRTKQGLTYDVYSQFYPLQYDGPFYIRLQTRNAAAKQALQLSQSILETFIKEGPSNEELVAAKKHIIDGFPLRIDSNRSIASILTIIGFYQLPLNYLDTFRQKVAAVTVNKIHRAFRNRVHPKQLVTVMVGNEKYW